MQCVFHKNFHSSIWFKALILCLFQLKLMTMMVDALHFNIRNVKVIIKNALFFPTVVNIKWVLDSVSVTEGVNRTVGLRAESSGIFARPIAIGIACSPVIATNVIPGMYVMPHKDKLLAHVHTFCKLAANLYRLMSAPLHCRRKWLGIRII